MLRHVVYVRPRTELADPRTKLLQVQTALYGLSDSGDYWHDTFPRVLKDGIGLTFTTVYMALCYNARGNTHLEGLILTQVDDLLGARSIALTKTSLLLDTALGAKPREAPLFPLMGCV